MRKLATLFLKVLPALLVLFSFTGLRAQGYEYKIANQSQTLNTFEFDLLLLDTDATSQIQIATVQAGIFLSNTVYNGGTISAAIIAGSSTMNSSQVPTSVTYTQTANIIKLAAKAPPGCGGGTLMSTDPLNPTRLCRIRLTNSAAAGWTQNSVPALTFCFTTTPYQVKISEYTDACVNSALAVSPTLCFNTDPAYILNPITVVCEAPLPFAVTGGGSYCQGGMGMPVGLAGSEADVVYTLYKDGVAQVPTVTGTGAAISFGNQMAGTYTVEGTRVCPAPPNQTTPMTGSVIVTETPASTVEFTAAACDTYTWTLNGQTYTVSGDYTFVVGCVTNILHLTITPSSTVEFTAAACDTYTWAMNGQTYTVSGDYTFVAGCVTNILHLTITPSSTVEFTAAACDTYTWAMNGQTYTVSGDYTYVVGCVTNILHLTITPSSTVEFTAAACDTYTWAMNGQTYTVSGDYTYVVGCVTNVLHLTITPSSTVEFTAAACDSYTWALNGQTYTVSGDYTYVVGCVTNILHLTITPSGTNEFTASACDSYTWALNGQTYTVSGDYTFVNGCSTNILHLTITPSSTVEFTAAACDSYTWALNGQTYTVSGDYTYVVGCVTNILHLTITPSGTNEFTASACDSYTWALNGQTYTVSGDYTFVNGCSTNILHLTITPSSMVEFTASACDTYTWALNGMTYTVSGDYTYVVGCVTNVLHLTVTPTVTPLFTQMGPYLVGSVPGMLPAISDNGILGTWDPATISTAVVGSTVYTFTPATGQCATTATMTIVIDPLPCNAVETWNGSVDNDWFNAANWTPAAVPCATTAVTIPVAVNYPTLTAGAVVASITILDGASFIGSEFLTTGNAQVDRNFPVPGYHYLSSPVVNNTFGTVFPLAQNNVWAYVYDEPTGMWENQYFYNTMETGVGYSVKMDNSQVAKFAGQLNANPVALSLSKLNPSTNINRVGWNLVGNPFTSALVWDNVIKGANVDGGVYVWNGSSYISYVGGIGALTGGIIPAENAFMVKTNVHGESLIIPFAARTHSNIPFYKSSFSNLLTLKAEGNSLNDEAFINFNDNASAGFDSQLDAYKLMGVDQLPALYSMIPGEVLSVNSLPMEGNEVVNMGFKCGVNGTYSVSASGIESFDATTPIWLEDLKTGATQNLRSNAVYSFDYSTTDNENRFRLHFKSANGVPGNAINGINIYSVLRTVVINNTTGLSGEVFVYDVAGRELVHSGMSAQMETRIPMNAAVGTYLVKVVTEKGVSSAKVIVR